jgi:phage shock protein A
MNILSRIRIYFSSKTNAALDRIEDPHDTLDFGYARQRELHQKVKQGLIEVATSRRQLETQAKKLNESVPQLEEQAQRALSSDREDLARMALQRKQTCLAELARLETQLAEVAEEERKLTLAEQQFAQRLDTFRTRRNALSAQYTAAEAQVRIHETLGSVSDESAELGVALERAEGKITRMQARASALDALIDNGSLTPLGGEDLVERELQELTASKAVEEELAALKAKLVVEKPRSEIDEPQPMAA